MDGANSVIGLFSDIHANLEAARRGIALLKREGAREFVFLGDCVGYGPDIDVISFLRTFSFPLRCLIGNHDQMFLRGDWPSERDDIYRYGRAHANMSKADFDFMRAWPTYYRQQTTKGASLMFHGGPEDPLAQYVYPDDPLPKVATDITFVFMGHTHRPFLRSMGNTTYVNVGSCGLPRDRGDLGSVCLFDPVLEQAHILRYDITDITHRLTSRKSVHPSVSAVFARRTGGFVGTLCNIEGEI